MNEVDGIANRSGVYTKVPQVHHDLAQGVQQTLNAKELDSAEFSYAAMTLI